ncbi:hypothetical protein MMC32_002238 [Xylographa parallela]|nr:hypothetical protein [Xylographa parallela]
MSYFSAVFHPTTTQATSLKSSLYGGLRKRKRQDSLASTDNEELATVLKETTADNPQRQSTARTTLDENDAPVEHLRDVEERHQQSPGGTYSPWELGQELAFLNPPLACPMGARRLSSPDGRRLGLKQQHLVVLTTIMHRSLAQGEYMRAGRAWGMLLRAEVKGHPQNIRSNGLWGLGAELILQRSILSEQDVNPQGNLEEYGMPDHSERATEFNHNLVKAQFTREGFEGAKAYYERLILQFPWRKWLPDALSSLHFYPVMFGLWISFVQDQYQSALARMTQDFEDPSDGDSFSGHVSSEARSAERHNNRSSSMQSCKAIAERLDELLQSFPYSDSDALWRVQAMNAQWMSDLSKEDAGTDQQSEKDVSENNSDRSSEHDDERSRLYARPIASKDVQGKRSEESERYLAKARRAFETAEKLKKQSGDRGERRDAALGRQKSQTKHVSAQN